MGEVLRVGEWNIERGRNFELIRTALNPAEFLRLTNSEGRSDSQREMIESQLSVCKT
jgi:hypothetical protein